MLWLCFQYMHCHQVCFPGLQYMSEAMVKLSWWRHKMETFSAWLAICTGNSPVPREFPAQRPVTRSFDFFSLICVWMNDREDGDLRRYRAHYDIIVMLQVAAINTSLHIQDAIYWQSRNGHNGDLSMDYAILVTPCTIRRLKLRSPRNEQFFQICLGTRNCNTACNLVTYALLVMERAHDCLISC